MLHKNKLTFSQWQRYCAAAHARVKQKYGQHPYSYHLRRVDQVLLRFGITAIAYRYAAWGHDLIEDTKETRQSLASRVSMLALAGIWGVTDAPGPNRKIRKRRTYPKIARYRIAIIIKLADRIANVEENIRTGNVRQFGTYNSEHAEMEAVLRNRNDAQAERLWLHLERLFADGRQLMATFASGGRVEGVPA